MKSTTLRTFLLLALGLVLGASLTIGHSVFAEREEAAATSLPLAELRTFTEVFGRVKSDYVESVDDKTLLNHAIRGMLEGLDPHSAYLDADAYKELQIGTSGEFGGLGLEVSMENGLVKVVAPIDDTPASRGGIQAGDLIVRLDDTPLQGMSLNDAVNLMRGKVGTSIALTILRKGEEKPLKITLTRAIIKVKSVKSNTLAPGYGYVRVSQFQAQTGSNLIEAVGQLKKDNGGSLKGLVLDLRNDPGGVLSAAVTVSDAFLEKGLIVYTEGRVKDSKMRFTATPDDILKGAPMVVLVNGGSASASEIVAGALQDHKRAVIMGSKTFGKGSVQTILPVTSDTALKLTTARYYTPSGRSIQAEGIMPDIIIDNVKLAVGESTGVEPLKEADLSRHLINGNGQENKSKASPDAGAATDAKQDQNKEPLISSDFQLHEALNLLKGLTILQSRTSE